MFKKINNFVEYFKYLKNPVSCLFFKFGLKKNVTVKFKDNHDDIKISNISTINIIMTIISRRKFHPEVKEFFVDCDSDNEVIHVLNGINIYNPRLYHLNHIFEEYYMDYYSNFNINWKNRTIIDIGANSGDSTLYFASFGSEVYGFEPVKEYYEMALKNIELNQNIKDNIKFLNKGVSYKNGKITIDSLQSTSGYINDNDSYDIEIVSIEDILTYVKPDILKMDCEGCEFEIIENCDLSMFNELIFEYHSYITGKDYRILANKLQKEGFNLEYSTVFNRNIEEIGFIHAYK